MTDTEYFAVLDPNDAEQNHVLAEMARAIGRMHAEAT